MNRKECFDKFILTRKTTHKEFEIAKEYYKEASSDSQKTFEMVCSNIGAQIFDFRLSNQDIRLKACLRRYNLTLEDAEYMVGKYTVKESRIMSALKYWSLTKPDLEAFLKEIFEKCLLVGWKKENLESIAQEYSINYEMLLQVLNEYLTKYDKTNTISMEQILYEIKSYEDFKKFIRTSCIPSNEAIWYLENKASAEEAALYKTTLEQIQANNAAKFPKNSNGNHNENNAKRILDSKHYKLLTMILEEANETDITRYIDDNNIRIPYFRSNYLNLFIEYFSKTHNTEEVQEFKERFITAYNKYIKKKQNKKNKYYQFCLMLISNENLPFLYSQALKEEINIQHLKQKYIPHFITEYAKEYSEQEAQRVGQILKENFQKFLIGQERETSIIKHNSHQDEILTIKYRAISYIHSESLKAYIEAKKGFKLSDEELRLLNKLDPNLYAYYCAKIDKHLYFTLNEINRLVYFLKKGITENGITRPFNILDYYLIFNKPLEYILEATNSLSLFDKSLITKFVRQNRARIITINEIYALNMEFNCENDANGFPISGTGIIPTLEEKEQIIKYLIGHYLPITIATYQIALARYLNGQLTFNQEEQPKM